jgi:hypothetical protein
MRSQLSVRVKIHVSPQSRQEQASLDALRPYLRPWRITLLDQRDDFGRDGIVQVVDEDREGNAFISPLTFEDSSCTDFTNGAASVLGAGAEISREFTARISALIQDDLRAFRLPVKLKFRFLESFGAEYVVGRSGHRGAAFSSTSANGEVASVRQRQNWARFSHAQLAQRELLTAPYSQCPCGSPDRFRFCCGRPLSKF